MTVPDKRTDPLEPAAFRLERRGSLGVLWFDLPGEKVNKFSTAVMKELDAFLDLISTSTELTHLVFASGKPDIFIAGADVSEFSRVESSAQAEEFIRFGQNVFAKIERLPQITVAAIHGACVGGGCELALSCDYRAMSDGRKSSIGLPETKLGILPAWGGTTKLPRLIGIPAALDLILTGKTLDAKRAKRAGLVDEILPAAIAVEAAITFAKKQKVKRGKDGGKSRLLLEGNPLGRGFVFRKARAGVMEKTRGHYPAHLKVIEVMETGFSESMQAGLRAEARAAGELVMTDESRNLVRLFFLMESAKKESGPHPRKIDSAGVLGAGLMGGGIAYALAEKEISVRLRDIQYEALAGGLKAASKIWRKKLERRRITAGEMQRKLSRITTTTDWSGFSRVQVVIEAVVEKLEVKQKVLQEFEAASSQDAIFATNTSTIPITDIASGSARPENVVGMHFFSPVDKMPLVEIIRGEKTSEQTVATIAALGRAIGKTVVVCNDGPGFIVNRILGPYMNEAGYLLEEGNSIDSIDEAMLAFGMPLGPLELLDQVGIDVASKAAEVLLKAFGARMKSSSLISKLIADQRFGKKNGRGIYQWTEGKRGVPDAEVYRLAGVSAPRAGESESMRDRMVLGMINEASLVLEEGIARSAGDIDLAMILGTGFPPFRGGLLRYADSLGTPELIRRLKALAAAHGPRFEPAAALRKMAEKDERFYND